MLRLTVGRRMALVVAVAIAATSLITILLVDNISNRWLDQSAVDLRSVSQPIARAIELDIDRAHRLLVSEAAEFELEDEEQILRHLRSEGFATAATADSVTGESRIEVSTNYLQRAAMEPAIGPTLLVDGRVGVVMGAPLIGAADAGDVLLGVYDATGVMSIVESATSGESTEALLAVRNFDDEIVIFTPSRHNDDAPIGATDDTTSDLVAATLAGGDVVASTNVTLNGRDSVAVLTPVASPRWVLLAATDREDAGLVSVPWWIWPAIVAIGGVALLPIASLRTRLKVVVGGAQQLSRGRLSQELTDPTDDEIGLLARTLQILDDRLQTDTEQRGRSAAMLQHRASHDPLTGLANRTRLMEELTVALNNRNQVAVLFCDIDDFKGINDSQGHDGGDIVLKFVANQLASACGPNELIARFGGDEFCVLSKSGPQQARILATRVERALDSTCIVNGEQQRIGGSVGMSIAKVTDTPDSILKSADLAMYREKERRRGLRRSNRRPDDEFVSTEQIRLAYQPVVELAEQRIVGVEVLARYMHPELGMLDPSSFLPPGTEKGMFDRFDLEILTQSMVQLSEWLAQGVIDERFTMSVNLAPDHVSDSDSTRQIFEIVRQHRIPTTMIQIEVTEHKLFAHHDDLINSLHALRENGIKVAIDDFGVEESNVDRLVQIPSDVVKIDRSFVSEIDIDERAENRLRAILEIVTTEGRVPIAEGVERLGQARVLRSLGVVYGQGYLWHAPISALALAPLLGRASRWSRKKPVPQPD